MRLGPEIGEHFSQVAQAEDQDNECDNGEGGARDQEVRHPDVIPDVHDRGDCNSSRCADGVLAVF